MKSFWMFACILVLVLPNAVSAGEKGELVSLLADYADLKQRVQEVREARKSGYASDTKALMNLEKELHDAKMATFRFRNSIHKAESGSQTVVTTTYMGYAYAAMQEIVRAEIDRNLFIPQSDVPVRLAEKYEEIWRMVDSSIPIVNVSSEAHP